MIVLEHVEFAYDRHTVVPVRALADVSVRIDRETCLGVVGAAGSGKTTLLQILCGLLPPTRGRVRVDGKDLTRSADLRNRMCFRVGLVFQFPERQLFEGTVFEDVAYGPKNMDLGRAEVEERVRRALARVGLDPDLFSPRSPLELSFGEMRRVALAGILAMEPEILLLDEPTAGLDQHGRSQLGALVRSLHEQGTGIVIASHDVEFLSEHVRDLLLLEQGRVAAEGRAVDVFADAGRLRAAGVAAPFLSQVVSGLAARGRPIDVREMTYPGVAEALVS